MYVILKNVYKFGHHDLTYLGSKKRQGFFGIRQLKINFCSLTIMIIKITFCIDEKFLYRSLDISSLNQPIKIIKSTQNFIENVIIKLWVPV